MMNKFPPLNPHDPTHIVFSSNGRGFWTARWPKPAPGGQPQPALRTVTFQKIPTLASRSRTCPFYRAI